MPWVEVKTPADYPVRKRTFIAFRTGVQLVTRAQADWLKAKGAAVDARKPKDTPANAGD